MKNHPPKASMKNLNPNNLSLKIPQRVTSGATRLGLGEIFGLSFFMVLHLP